MATKTAGGEGCSTCTGGQGTYTYMYEASTFGDDPNVWKDKVTEELPDGTENITYTNAAGKTVLSDVKSGSDEWRTYTRRDADHRVVWTAQPSNVTGYDEDAPNLVEFSGGNATYLSDTAGLIYVTDYASATSPTITETTAGAVDGYASGTGVKHGETGTPVAQSATTYYKRTAGGATVFPVATSTAYPDDAGTGAEKGTGGEGEGGEGDSPILFGTAFGGILDSCNILRLRPGSRAGMMRA